MGTFPKIFAYYGSVHSRLNREIPQEIFACRAGCQEFLAEVQDLADRRGGDGDKTDGRLYLHYMQLVDGYPRKVHEAVLKELGLWGQKKTASLDDMVQAAEQRAFDHIASKILQSQGKLSPQETGRILYVLGTLLHAHQDRKHLKGNLSDGNGDGVTSSAHYSWDLHQFFSDAWPSEGSEKEANGRSIAFLERFQSKMKADTGDAATEAFARLANFKMEPGKRAQDYKPFPQDMDRLFPSYPTRDMEVQGHFTFWPGYFWGRVRSGFTGEAGMQWYLPRTGFFRFQAGLGINFTHDQSGRSEVGLKSSLILAERADFLGVGVSYTLGYSSKGEPYPGVEGVVKLFEGTVLLHGGHFWYPNDRGENRFSLSLDALALARSFEWINRDR